MGIHIKFYSILNMMKRGSLITPSNKREAWRKYPSAVIKSQAQNLFKSPSPQNPLAIALTIATTLCEAILQQTDEAIQRIQANNFLKRLQDSSNNMEKYVMDAISPTFQENHHSLNRPEDQPHQTTVDFLCSGEKHVQKKMIKRQFACISAFNTPLKQLKQKEKLCTSTKQLGSGQKRSVRSQLVPLKSADCEEDVRSTLLQTFYRDKFAREDQINQEQNIPKPQLSRMFRKTNARDKEQFAFDYDGQKIPIIASNSLKNNPVKVLKTFYKVHKDRMELRHGKRTHESVRFPKFPEVTSPSHRFLENGTDLHELKRGIQQNVHWGGKLQSIKLITQNEQSK